MSILVDRDTRVLVQGITGREGSFHTEQMVEYGTNVVSGVTPGGKGKSVAGAPVFDTVADAVAETAPNVAIIFVPARFAPDAIYEAIDNGLPLVVCITEGIPVADMVPIYAHAQNRGTRLLGPNCPGLITPDEAKVGIMPGFIHTPGPVGVVSRSGTLTYEVVDALSRAGTGQSTAVGIGGDPVIGTSFVDVLGLFEADPATEAIVMIGEIGGNDEETAARLHPGTRDQTCRWFHRWPDRSTRQAHGSCWGDHLRWLRHRRGEDGRARVRWGSRRRPALGGTRRNSDSAANALIRPDFSATQIGCSSFAYSANPQPSFRGCSAQISILASRSVPGVGAGRAFPPPGSGHFDISISRRAIDARRENKGVNVWPDSR